MPVVSSFEYCTVGVGSIAIPRPALDWGKSAMPGWTNEAISECLFQVGGKGSTFLRFGRRGEIKLHSPKYRYIEHSVPDVSTPVHAGT